MIKTITLKLKPSTEHSFSLAKTQEQFKQACNLIVPIAVENRCWNRVALHHLSYYNIRTKFEELGSQMVCNAIKNVCAAFKVLKIKRSQEVPRVNFKKTSSVHYDKRTYSFKKNKLSLFTVSGRIACGFVCGDFQKEYLKIGIPKEAELIKKGDHWFFNVCIEIPNVPIKTDGTLFSIDVGENNLATTSNGTIYGGSQLRHERDKFLARRSKLQSNGSKAAFRCLKRISGKEKLHVKETNHIVSKAIVKEAINSNTRLIVMEDLTNIRKRIKARKRVRSRLHRWAWRELQQFIDYKAKAMGIDILYVNPAYTSKTCSSCGVIGSRHKHLFKCYTCGSYQHSDRNAAANILKLGESAVSSTATVNMPMVATLC